VFEFDMRALQAALDGEGRAQGLNGISLPSHDLLVFPGVSQFADPWRTPKGNGRFFVTEFAA
jgi:hypothetical protein